ncbi:iron-sulfur cluster biosynthesis transcriptional regulator SufR [Gloeocapsa sp. PCC 73106]|uniref:iron-sulfur cluster biosynthesis transcriptional regulator SufR n=1 Tax=Gloeocapsa sp. PCC 73106 TaxID=102232 RepID=UPI0002ABA260|nr:iron-sulfur cluster biosynthesis transcriptional regulator SufR [Gloeocapsa sp. PCC 73106]ELR96797.1 iron-sulfur cluster biosynthesis transcriptional regulator SufR [Gloeocapsa sp. PCC 73106]
MIESSSSKQDILKHLLRKRQAAAKELAQTLEISPQATRRHLKDLEIDGLIERQKSRSKMGRPEYIYQLSRQGRDRFPNGYGEFAVSFLDTLAQTVGEEQLNTVLRKQWERKAGEYQQRIGTGNLQERVAKLLELRQAEGYMAELHLMRPNSYVLAEHHCAISDVAESYPSVCGHELEMFAAILPDCKIERTHWINNGEHRCGYLIELI